MEMPDKIDDIMFAPCGMNCTVCYKHIGIQKHAKPCEGCLKGDLGKPEHCRKCNIKSCVAEGIAYCFECVSFPCKLIKKLEKSYNMRYATSLVQNSLSVKESGINSFMQAEYQKWTCVDCGGIISLHDAECSECMTKIQRTF